jgi:BarA-like signal transduction histidine kinase
MVQWQYLILCESLGSKMKYSVQCLTKPIVSTFCQPSTIIQAQRDDNTLAQPQTQK